MSVILRKILNMKDQTMTSREIAELTGKRHDNIMRDIEKMFSELEYTSDLRSANKSSTYKEKEYTSDLGATRTSFYIASNGKKNKMYMLDRDESICLVSGYNVNLRMAIIKRWTSLETANNHNITYNHFREQSCDGHNELYGVLLDYTNDDESITRKQIAISHKVRRQVGLSSDLNWNEATNEQLAERDDLLRYYNRLIKKGLANDFKQFIEIY